MEALPGKDPQSGAPSDGSLSEDSASEKSSGVLQPEHDSNELVGQHAFYAPLGARRQEAPPTQTRMDRRSSTAAAGPSGDERIKPVSWMDLPRKDQLIVITLTRLSEPLVQTSLQAYMVYQLRWFDPTLPDSVISTQAGILHASFTAAQLLTAMLWGRLADSARFGRKTVVLVGLGGTMLSCIGYGFSTTFSTALFFRSLGGITNGNVGVLRTMISEIIQEKKYQSRAFLLLPMTFNIGVIVGPPLGGILSDLAGSYPSIFGHVSFFRDFPYAAPNIISAFILFVALVSVWLCLEETLDARRDTRDLGIELGRKIVGIIRTYVFRRQFEVAYTPLASRGTSTDVEMSPLPSSSSLADESPLESSVGQTRRRRPRYTKRLPFRRIFTRNVTFTLFSQFLMAFHVGTFNALWFVFLSTPVYDPAKPPQSIDPLPRRLPFFFTGGMGLQPREIGMAMSILGVLGIGLQLFLYPTLSARLGTVRSWRLFLTLFPVTYFIVPYLSLVPSSPASPPPLPKDGIAMWASIAAVLFLQVLGRTFALPANTILVNNCTPHPSVLGTLHGVAQSVSSMARTIGPMLCGYLYGLGLARGVVGAVWWGLSGVAFCGFLASWWVREGNGHEIWLEGDEEDE